jgi:phosphoribosylanthranilate isomerase
MIKVKICGLRREIDIEYVNRQKPDYIGFIFAESKRRIEPKEASRISTSLDRRIKKAGVFVNEKFENIVETVGICGLDIVQIHGDETTEFISRLKEEINGVEVWKAIRVKDEESIKILETYQADAFLLDAYVEGSYGGAGKSFDWNLASLAKKYGKIILAGGLNLSNITEAVRIVQPFAVDTSSGVETEGFKDEEKIKSFVYSVRRSEY